MRIIKPGKKSFVATCSRCGCQFEYTLEELMNRYPLSYMQCPDCENEVYHMDQNSQEYKNTYPWNQHRSPSEWPQSMSVHAAPVLQPEDIWYNSSPEHSKGADTRN